MSYNLPLLSIPAFYVLALVPHIVGSAIIANGKAYNPANPAGSQVAEFAKKELSIKDFAKFERSKSCHRNHIENIPLYIATILAGVYAERESGQQLGLTTVAASFLTIRVLYTISYITIESRTWAPVRSVLYFFGLCICFGSLFQSAKALGASS